MKRMRRLASILILTGSFSAWANSTGEAAQRQTLAFSAAPDSDQRTIKPSSLSAPDPIPLPQQQPTRSASEQRAQAYAKLLEGQRHLAKLRTGAGNEALGLARQAFQEAATLAPTLAEAHTALAEIAFYYPPQDFNAAALEGTNATRVDPDNFGGHQLLSRLFTIKSGLHERSLNKVSVELAIKELKEVARLDKNNAESWALLGEFYEATGRTEEALGAWERWAAAPPATDTRFFQYITNGRELGPDAAYARLGEALLKAGRTKEALSAIRSAIARDPENKDYVELLAQAVATGGVNDAAAIAELTRMLSSDPARLGAALLGAGRLPEALAAIRRAVALKPDNRNLLLLNRAFEADGSKDKGAIADVQRIVAADPANTLALQILARMKTRTGDWQEAVALLRGHLKGSPADFSLYLTISATYTEAGQGREAVDAAQKALELAKPEDQEMITAALLTLSSAQERTGDMKSAEESLRRVLASEPDNATALNNLGYFLTERNERLQEALEMIQRAVKAEPGNASFLDSLGWVYFKLGQLDKAEQNLSEAARGDTSSATIQEHLGELYQARSEPNKARAAWEKALSLSIEATQIARLKARLNGTSNE